MNELTKSVLITEDEMWDAVLSLSKEFPAFVSLILLHDLNSKRVWIK